MTNIEQSIDEVQKMNIAMQYYFLNPSYVVNRQSLFVIRFFLQLL